MSTNETDAIPADAFDAGFERIELRLTLEDAQSVAGAGQQDLNVRVLSRKPYVAKQLAAIDEDRLIEELLDYGAWDTEQLADHDQNLQRILWLAGCYVAMLRCNARMRHY